MGIKKSEGTKQNPRTQRKFSSTKTACLRAEYKLVIRPKFELILLALGEGLVKDFSSIAQGVTWH